MSLSPWLLAIRPQTLGASVVPVLVGTACAAHAGPVLISCVLAALIGAVGIQIGTNLANDLYDFRKGADTSERLGPTRVVQAGLLSEGQVLRGMCLAFGIATIAGLFLAYTCGPVIIAIGVLSILTGLAYTAGPFPLGYHGLGDLCVLLFFGFVAVCGSAFVAASEHNMPAVTAWIAAMAVGCLATALLVVNNLRDLSTDARAGKRTLAVRLGPRVTRLQYGLLLTLAFATPVFLWIIHASAWLLLPLLGFPLAVYCTRAIYRLQGRDLNTLLAQTGKLLLLYGVTFATGIWLS